MKGVFPVWGYLSQLDYFLLIGRLRIRLQGFL